MIPQFWVVVEIPELGMQRGDAISDIGHIAPVGVPRIVQLRPRHVASTTMHVGEEILLWILGLEAVFEVKKKFVVLVYHEVRSQDHDAHVEVVALSQLRIAVPEGTSPRIGSKRIEWRLSSLVYWGKRRVAQVGR